MPWYPCGCDYDPPPCGYCTDDNYFVNVEVSGFANDYCDRCAYFDSTYTLYRTGASACTWFGNRLGIRCRALDTLNDIRLTLVAGVLYPGSNVGWKLTIATRGMTPLPAGDTMEYRWDSGSTSDFDCTATRSLTHYSSLPDPNQALCSNLSGLTITVNP